MQLRLQLSPPTPLPFSFIMDARYVAAAAAAAAANDNNPRLDPLPLPRDDNSSSLPPLKPTSTTAITTATTTTTATTPDVPVAIYDIAKLINAKCTVFRGKVYNDKGHPICGVLNQHDRPCHRIGRCPFHYYSTPVSRDNVCNGEVDATGTVIPDNNTPISRSYDPATPVTEQQQQPLTPPKKMQYKHGWSKEEHYLFLSGLRTHGRGAWKQIAIDVKTRTATQVQSHAQKFYLRQKQQNKNKRSIHDLTLDSPEMSEIEKQFEKQLALDPNNPHHRHHHHHHGSAANTSSFDEFGSMFAVTNPSNTQHDTNRPLGLSPLDRASVAAAGFPLTFRTPMTGATNGRTQNQPSIVAPPWYTQPARSPIAQPRTSHDWTTTSALPLDQRYSEKRADALLDAAAAAPLRAPPQGADSLLYGTTTTNGYAGTYGTTGGTHASTTAQSYEEARAFGAQEAPSTNVLLSHGDGVSDILSGVKGITKPAHHFRALRSQRRVQSAVSSTQQQIIPDAPPFDQLTSPVTTQHSIPHAFLSGVDLQVNEHHPGEVQQPPRDVGALLSGAGRAVSAAQNER